MDSIILSGNVGPESVIRADHQTLLIQSDQMLGAWVRLCIRDAMTAHRLEAVLRHIREELSIRDGDPLTLDEVAA